MKNTVDIGLIVAMKSEAEMLASAIGLVERKTEEGNYITYMNESGDVVLLTPGIDRGFQCFGKPVCRVGKPSAGIMTTLLVEHFHPGCIINAGTAGGIKGVGVEIGEVVIADSVSSHDVRIPLPGYDKYGVRKISTDNLDKLRFLSTTYKVGQVSSGESFTSSAEEWKIIRQSKALVKDMEAAGVIQAREILGLTIPMYVIKAVTDINDESIQSQTAAEEFSNNFNAAMMELSQAIKEIVENRQKILC